jgi:hypothetical protein
MMVINATALDRKSGGAQWRDLRFSGPFLEMFFDRAQRSREISVRKLCLGNVFDRAVSSPTDPEIPDL